MRLVAIMNGSNTYPVSSFRAGRRFHSGGGLHPRHQLQTLTHGHDPRARVAFEMKQIGLAGLNDSKQIIIPRIGADRNLGQVCDDCRHLLELIDQPARHGRIEPFSYLWVARYASQFIELLVGCKEHDLALSP